MSDDLIRKSDVLNLLNKTKVALWYDNFAGAVLIAIHDAVEDMPPVNAVEMNDDLISRQAAIDAIKASASKYTGFMGMEMFTDDDAVEAINGVPSAQPEWNNHTVACLLKELFDDTCACNYS